MNQVEFLEALATVGNQYVWSYDSNRLTGISRRGTNRGVAFNPVTAVANSSGVGVFRNTKRDTLRAARAIGMSPELANAIYSQSNRGHAQIVRGKMLSTLF